MRKIFVSLVSIALLLSLAALPALGYVEKGNKLGDLEFGPTITPEDAKYLGVAEGKPFKLSQVGAPFVLVEVFGTGCSHCFTHAPHMNEAFNMLNKDAQTAGKIKMIGLAQGDSPDNVMSWKQQFKVPFALVPDPDSKTTDKINVMGTPTFVVMNKKGDVLFAQAGASADVQGFVDKIKAAIK